MDSIFPPFKARTAKREATKKAGEAGWAPKSEDAAPQATAEDTLVMYRPVTAGALAEAVVGQVPEAIARMGTLAFRPSDVASLSELEIGAEVSATFRMRVEETPAEFAHLYASLERIVERAGSIPTITCNLMETERPYVLGVSSAVAGEGKTTTALHLARTIAHNTTKRVCLVDLGLEAGGIASRLGLPWTGDGLVAAVEDDVDTFPCFTVSGFDNLTVVPAGRAPVNPARFVRTPRIAQFLIATRHAFDVVVVDMPAVGTGNAAPLTQLMDSVVMVVRAGVTPREVVTEALETLGPDRVNCVILNRSKPAMPKWLQKRYGRV